MTMLDHVRGPWSRRRASNLACAVLAAVPGVRRYVLSTTPLKEHPMYEALSSADTAADFDAFLVYWGYPGGLDGLRRLKLERDDLEVASRV